MGSWAGQVRYEVRGGRFYQVKPPPVYWNRPREPAGLPPAKVGTGYEEEGRKATRNRHRDSRSKERTHWRKERSRFAAIGTGCGRGTVRAPHDLRSDAGRTSAAKHQTPRVRMRV